MWRLDMLKNICQFAMFLNGKPITYLRRPMTKPENFLKFSSLLNLVLSNITRSQVLVWVGPA